MVNEHGIASCTFNEIIFLEEKSLAWHTILSEIVLAHKLPSLAYTPMMDLMYFCDMEEESYRLLLPGCLEEMYFFTSI
jgi:hypothetical protein